MKALSFLGLGNYKCVTYVWEEAGRLPSQCQTHLFPEAVAQIFRPEKILLLVTESARGDQKFREQLRELANRLGDVMEPVSIPDGKSTQELWEIFDACAERIGEGDRLMLDVTHAFGSLPLIVFTVGAYLRRTKNVTIERIVYGAYEAREPHRPEPLPTDRVPIFDLTPLLDLLDWLSGTEAFLRHSDTTLLADRLAETRRALGRSYPEDTLPRKLEAAGKKLGELGEALHLSRPRDMMRLAGELLRKLDEAEAEIEKWAKPFRVILDQTRKEIKPMAHFSPDVLDSENLRKQLALIEHYERKGLIVQAVTLAREWMVSWMCLKTGKATNWLDESCRRQVEDELNEASSSLRRSEYSSPNPWITPEVASMWNDLVLPRNAVAHCGMRKNVPSASTIAKTTREILERMRSLL